MLFQSGDSVGMWRQWQSITNVCFLGIYCRLQSCFSWASWPPWHSASDVLLLEEVCPDISKPVSNTLPWPLYQLLTLGVYPDFFSDWVGFDLAYPSQSLNYFWLSLCILCVTKSVSFSDLFFYPHTSLNSQSYCASSGLHDLSSVLMACPFVSIFSLSPPFSVRLE